MSTEVPKSAPDNTVPRSKARPGRHKRQKRGSVEPVPVRPGVKPAPAAQVDPARGFLEPELVEPSPRASEDVER
jgi:hypothetical protein